MFPLSFPLRVMRNRPVGHGWIADPFCGRGTTNLAARLNGVPTFGMDSSPIAVAIAEAKLCDTTVGRIEMAAQHILGEDDAPTDIPKGRFWRQMYHKDVLQAICKLRNAFLRDCRSDARKVLRAIILGALHGPLTKAVASHLSNQSPRTYAPSRPTPYDFGRTKDFAHRRLMSWMSCAYGHNGSWQKGPTEWMA